MSQRASDAERAYWRKLASANDELAREERPPDSLDEVFRRMDAIRARLGALAEPGLPADDRLAMAENLRLRARWRAKEARVRPDR